MRFARHLEEYQLPEWRGSYLAYVPLKQALHELCAGRLEAAATRLESSRPSSLQRQESGQSAAAASDNSGQSQGLQLWWQHVETEVQRVGGCVRGRLAELARQISALEAVRCERGSYTELQLLEGLQRVSQGLTRLQSFAELNHAALYKIARKHDKLLGGHYGLATQLPGLAESLGKKEDFERLEAKIRSCMLQCSQCTGLEASPRVALLVACLGQERSGNPVTLRREQRLFFFLGTCIALLLMMVILLALPVMQPETFNSAYFLSSFAVYRVVWSVALIFWAMGAVARACEGRFVNHLFILGVDPRCRFTPSYFFGKAALLSSLWILMMGLYILDYKWMLLPTERRMHEKCYRCSWHFVLYPSLLLAATLLLLLLPSRVCLRSYKLGLLRCLGRTCLAPFFAVSFADNLLGDVLTSLAKPMEDVPGALCYLSAPHPQPPENVGRFIKSGNLCPVAMQVALFPLIAAAPFVFRLLQCARRYRDTRELKHLANLGKYATSLLVLVITRTFKEWTSLIVVISCVATCYAATWDIAVDWGIDCAFIRSCLAPQPAVTPCEDGPPVPLRALNTSEELLERVTTQEAEAGDSHVAQAFASPGKEKRHFGLRIYLLAACLDVAMRMTWVLTLIPISLLSDDIVQRAVFQTCISTVEICRRTMWTILRIENEQVNNASGFRALHWVPLQLGASSSAASIR